MKSVKSLVGVGCIAVMVLNASPGKAALPPPASPLTVTLSLANPVPCPIGLDQAVGLKAKVSGGYVVINTQPVVNHYTFSVDSPTSAVIKQDTTDPTVWWVPKLPGYYSFSVNVKQFLGSTVVAQASGQLPGLCEIKKVAYQVTFNVSPPSGQAEAPPPTDAKRLTLSASISNPFGNPTNEFRFSIAKMGAGSVVAFNTVRTNRFDGSWTASNPPQPADPGLYTLSVQVVALQPSPQGDVVVAEGEKQIVYYEAKPARAFGNVNVRTGDQTMVKVPPASQPPTARLEVGGYGILEGLQDILIISHLPDLPNVGPFYEIWKPYGCEPWGFADANGFHVACHITAKTICERLIFATNNHGVGSWSGQSCRLKITGSPVSVTYDNT
ncbi:MAG: hypothetical protein M3041_06615, partial [Acidobacteriota bacterium]|nr:hypothetical protein [Acidobacteriota bacterium]